MGSPAVADGRVYFAASDSGQLHALDAASGISLFSLRSSKWPMFSSPAIAGDFLYVGSHEGKLFAVDLKAQKLAWTFQPEAAKQNGSALTKPDGAPKYEAAFDGDFYDDMVAGVKKMLTVGAILSSPAVADGVIFFGSTDGTIYACTESGVFTRSGSILPTSLLAQYPLPLDINRRFGSRTCRDSSPDGPSGSPRA